MNSARHALVAVCVFGVLVAALGLYRNEHRLGSFIPAQTDTTGTLQTDALGNLSVASDERLKDIEGDYTRGLDAILGIEPISYRWKSSTGYDTANVYTGFSAQNIKDFIPEAVGEDKKRLPFAFRPPNTCHHRECA